MKIKFFEHETIITDEMWLKFLENTIILKGKEELDKSKLKKVWGVMWYIDDEEGEKQ